MCTNIKIQAKTGEVFWGRTMDLAMPLFPNDMNNYVPCVITSIPANSTIESQLENWESLYCAMEVGINGASILLDGVNEHGLAGDTQVLMECTWAEHSEIKAQGKLPIIAEELVSYILTTCKSVSEVKERVDHYMLVNQTYKYGNTEFHYPLHFSFVDSRGEGVVIETDSSGALTTCDYLNVMTNSPKYDYHQVNIRNYIGMRTQNLTDPRTLPNGKTFDPIERGTGYGMFGLPGDYTSPSRFVRSFCLATALDPFDATQGMNELYTIFRSVMIPKGLEREPQNPTLSDYTRYWSGYNLNEKELYVQTGESLVFNTCKLDPTIKQLTFKKIVSVA